MQNYTNKKHNGNASVLNRQHHWNHLDYYLIGFISSIFLATFISCFYLIEEDAYIYFRFAENIAQGNGYAFNHGGEKIEGGSSPLWLLLLSGLIWSGLPSVTASKLLGYVFGLATIVLIYRVALQLSINRCIAAATALSLCFSIPYIYWANAGLDTPLYSFLLLAFIFSLWKAELVPLTIVATLTLFARPEAIFVVVLTSFMAMIAMRQHAKKRLIAISISLFLYSIYELFRLWYFNDLQISPFYAKPQTKTFSISEVGYFVGNYNLYFVALGLTILPLLSIWKKQQRSFIFIGITALALTAMFAAANGDFKLFHRFYVPAIALLLLLCAIACSIAIKILPHKLRSVAILLSSIGLFSSAYVPNPAPYDQPKTKLNPIANGLSLLNNQGNDAYAVLMSLFHGEVDRHLALPHQKHLLQNSSFYVNYQAQTGFFLNDIAPQGAVIAYDQMGQAAYFGGADKTYIDMLGLMDKRIGLYYFTKQKHNNWLNMAYLDLLAVLSNKRPQVPDDKELAPYIYELNPDLILIHSFVVAVDPQSTAATLDNSLKQNSNYLKCGMFANMVTLYKRKDVTLNPPQARYGNFQFKTSDIQQGCFLQG